jgi:peptide/nickel transport system ATP-binding protein
MTNQEANEIILNIRNLKVRYETQDGIVKAVNGVDLTLRKKRTLGLVGETGAGKTTTALAIMRLVPNPPGVVECDKIRNRRSGHPIAAEHKLEHVRGNDVSMIFQDPMTALNQSLQ